VTRWIAVAAGLAFVVVAFGAATFVADTREGLIAEVVTLFAGLAGVLFLVYGLVPRRAHSPEVAVAVRPQRASGPRSLNDLIIGSVGLLIAAILLTGLLMSAGWQWAMVGTLLLLPMIAGCVYLCAAFLAAPERVWKMDLGRLIGHR
jgi:hypothetical protein